MAYIRKEYCPHCEKKTTHVNQYCEVCSERQYREKVGKWNSMTTDEKLQDLRRRIEHLESDHPTY